MAYSRWGKDSNWFIFWLAPRASAREDEYLAVWPAHRVDPENALGGFTYRRIREILRTDDYSCVAGFTEVDRLKLRECFSDFVKDVDEVYDSEGDGDQS